jgi:phage gpG-like protein
VTAPIRITGTVTGVEAVTQRLSTTKPAEARARLRIAIQKLGYQLQRNVVTNQLNGGVLARRSGRLARSINTRFLSAGDTEAAIVGTNLIYGRIWELTGSRAYVIRPKIKKALFWAGAANPYRSANHPAQSPRPFLKPALNAMRPQIRETLTEAMRNL